VVVELHIKNDRGVAACTLQSLMLGSDFVNRVVPKLAMKRVYVPIPVDCRLFVPTVDRAVVELQ